MTPTSGFPEAPEHDPLPADALFRACDPERFEFETTDELENLTAIVGQARASRAVRFGIGMKGDGFNIYALGPEETDKQTLVRHFLEDEAASRETPPDLCYVNNFDHASRPCTLVLPSGTAGELARDLDDVLGELRTALESAFEGEEYQSRRQALQEEAGAEHQEALERLQEKARERDLALMRTPAGFVFAPVRDGEVLDREEIEELSDEEREAIEEEIEELQDELQQILRQVPQQEREGRERVRELNREIARRTVQDVFTGIRKRYSHLDRVTEHLDAVEDDVVENIEQVMGGGHEQQGGAGQIWAQAGGGEAPGVTRNPVLRRYRINVLVDQAEAEEERENGGAPVVYEENPTYQNLVGRVEHLPIMGALVTDFNLIKPGALHRANGGYLMLDVRRVLIHPFAWEGLKRVLKSGEIRIESPREAMGLVSTVSLDPEPVKLDVKVVLLGSRMLYYLLSEFDPDFGDLFKVEADFDDRMDRSRESESVYASLVGSLVQKEDLRPFDRSAVARVIERSARIVGDSEKLSVRTRRVIDLVREADFWAGEDGADTVSAPHVQQAVDEWIHRSSRIRERMQEEILRETIYIDSEGEEVGQLNGLSVLQLGGYSFGRPSRITARVRLGRGRVMDIEREVELGGPIHSKGVMILTGFLGQRYASDRPLALAASLVFEQSYSGIEGDSASSAELYALLSAISGVPLSQGMAVTGSVNQHGEIQPIGGVNEKIEGFFDICEARGLTGEQGVLIPASNVKHLMLREDVREAVEAGDFHVWAVETVDQGMEILTGLPMGERDEDGVYPEGTVNRKVEDRLAELAEARQTFLPAESGEDAAD